MGNWLGNINNVPSELSSLNPTTNSIKIFFCCLFLLLMAGTADAQATYSFPAAAAVGASETQSITVNIQHGGTLGTVEVLTSGSPNLDFTLAAAATTGGTYSPNQPYSVSVQFAPKYPGARHGAIVLLDTNGNVMATQILFGLGQASLAVMEAGEITTVVGNGHLVNDGSGTSALSTSIHEPLGVAVDGAGDIFYSDSGYNAIRRVDAVTQAVTTVAGNGVAGFSPNGTLAANAELNTPAGLVLDGAGNIFFADSGNNVIREINYSAGAKATITTIAGTGTLGYYGDTNLATLANLDNPQGLGFDVNGNLYIADTDNNVVREVNVTSGVITTVAGNGTGGYSGDGLGPTQAKLNTPWGVFLTPDNSLYIADFGNNVVRKVNSAGTTISTVAGTGTENYSGDGGAATLATLNRPTAVVVDAAGDIYIAEYENNCIRKVNGTTFKIVTIAGNGAPGFYADGQDANLPAAQLDKPYDLYLDGAGDLFIADRLNLRVREVYGNTASILYQPIKATNTSTPVPQNIENDGNLALNIASIIATSNSAIDPVSTTCTVGTPEAVGSSCIIGAEFKPATVGTPVTGSITINSDSANTPGVIDVSGNALSIFPTTTAVTGTPNAAGLGASVTFTATVSSTNPQPLTGTVSFYDNGVQIGTAQPLSSGKATYSTSTLALGSHPITATYSGDSGDATSTSSPAYIEVIKQVTTFVMSGMPNPSTVYQSVTFTATLTPTNANPITPTGNAVFSVDGNSVSGGTVALNNGIATYTTTTLSQGNHLIAATYAGDSSTLGNVTNSFQQTVNSATSTTVLGTSNATVLVTAPVTFTATVSGDPNSTPTGNVIFYADGTAMTNGTIALNSSGIAYFMISTLPPGKHNITATYQGDTNYGTSTSQITVETIQQINTTTTVNATANPGISGASIKFMVNITATNSTSPNVPITGTVNLMVGGTSIGSGPVTATGNGPTSTATATITLANFTPGSENITAVYSGDTNYVTSTSSNLPLQINIATTSNMLISSGATVIATKPVTLTATISGNGGTPTGTVTFYDGGTSIGTGTVNGSGVASLMTSSLAVGPHTIDAVYGGDTDDNGSTSNNVLVTIQSAATNTALVPSQDPTDFGQSLMLTATVTGNGGVPTGTVTFFDNTTSLAVVPMTNGVASYTTTALTDGSHPLTAKYSGDSNNFTSTSTQVNEQVLQTVTLGLTSTSPNPSTARTNVHFIATITPLQGIQPTGSITFLDGTNVLGSSSISGTTATFDTTALAVGTHQITASYSGDPSTEPLTSSIYSQTINAAGTSVTIMSSANPSVFGSQITLTANASSTTGALSGTVIFQDSGVSIGQGTLASGVATLNISTLSAGVHSIVAAYQGDTNDAPANSTALLQHVQNATTTTLSTTQNPVLTLTPFAISASVANGSATPATGNLNFVEDGVAVGTVPLSAGVATLSLPLLTSGPHTFVATYVGDSLNITSTSSPYPETVQLRATTDVLDSSATSLTGGQQVTLTSIIRWTGSVTPTGTVTFYDGTAALGAVAVDSQGAASLTVLLPGPTASITSTYSGDTNYAGSTSPATVVTIGPSTNINLTVSPTTITLPTGQHTNVTLTLTSLNNFTDTFALGCVGLPMYTTCTFSKDKVSVPAGGFVTATLTVDTGNPLGSGALSKNESATHSSLILCFLPGSLLLMFLVFPNKRLHSIKRLLLVLCMASFAAGVSGCGTTVQNSTPAGNYTLQVSALGVTGVSQYVNLPMTVTQ